MCEATTRASPVPPQSGLRHNPDMCVSPQQFLVMGHYVDERRVIHYREQPTVCPFAVGVTPQGTVRTAPVKSQALSICPSIVKMAAALCQMSPPSTSPSLATTYPSSVSKMVALRQTLSNLLPRPTGQA